MQEMFKRIDAGPAWHGRPARVRLVKMDAEAAREPGRLGKGKRAWLGFDGADSLGRIMGRNMVPAPVRMGERLKLPGFSGSFVQKAFLGSRHGDHPDVRSQDRAR
ncbi:MAG TPA: hypothetical protein VNS22_16630 [Geminicoccus sp.]|uniref:hypothetical protein n=1 Tax=Geminicoccus sp. TaxID=2024832 RepID=UPI002CCDB19C|nr:hypothetical protein [Geminicoccus sp.]HWL69994.1 hypothetical protein [Geminicoccus sp.]